MEESTLVRNLRGVKQLGVQGTAAAPRGWTKGSHGGPGREQGQRQGRSSEPRVLRQEGELPAEKPRQSH